MGGAGPEKIPVLSSPLFFVDFLWSWSYDVEVHSCRDVTLTSSSDPCASGILASGYRKKVDSNIQDRCTYLKYEAAVSKAGCIKIFIMHNFSCHCDSNHFAVIKSIDFIK